MLATIYRKSLSRYCNQWDLWLLSNPDDHARCSTVYAASACTSQGTGLRYEQQSQQWIMNMYSLHYSCLNRQVLTKISNTKFC